ncbi:hypothetical protein Kisp01_23020 [Kineosporia sp. NBRC 101677]|nr:hypothetical protein Kisp01_23020 [Kineosporia sp. NBRC 101677]
MTVDEQDGPTTTGVTDPQPHLTHVDLLVHEPVEHGAPPDDDRPILHHDHETANQRTSVGRYRVRRSVCGTHGAE